MMRKLIIIVVALVSLFLLFELTLGEKYNKKLKYFRDLGYQVYTLTLNLERQIGYGGLIHHFKNYLLRPTEEKYYQQALVSYDEALTLVDELEKISATLLSVDKLVETRAMLTTYKNRLDVIKQMTSNGATAQEVDKVVRYDDTPALSEISDLSERIQIHLESEIASLVMLNHTLLFVFMLFNLVFVSLIAYLFMYKQKELNKLSLLEKEIENKFLKKENQALEKFAAVVAHDLRAPIRYIDFCADKIKSNIVDASFIEKSLLD